MSENTWQWRDSGSGPGHMQRVRVNAEGKAQQAYRTFLDHSGCGDCQALEARCGTAEGLWQAYRAAQRLVRSL